MKWSRKYPRWHHSVLCNLCLNTTTQNQTGWFRPYFPLGHKLKRGHNFWVPILKLTVVKPFARPSWSIHDLKKCRFIGSNMRKCDASLLSGLWFNISFESALLAWFKNAQYIQLLHVRMDGHGGKLQLDLRRHSVCFPSTTQKKWQE